MTTTTMSNRKNRLNTYDMVCIAIFAAVMAVCAWVTIPTVVPFTLQTFGLFLTVAVLGGKRGSFAVLIYILLGIVGLPVFSGFGSGLGVILGTTGGYIIGFLLGALLMWALEKVLGRKLWALAVAMVLALILDYAVGTAWFMVVYAHQTGPVGLSTVLGWCVFPFIVPDLIKMVLALLLSGRVKKIVHN